MLLAASRLVLRELETRNVARESFAFETTLVGCSYLRLVERLRQQGWRVKLIDLALPSAEMSALRVAERVAHGGHSIPLSDIRRRFPRSLRHLLHDFSSRVDRCTCFMNHAFRPVLVFERKWTFAHDPRSQLVSAAAQRGPPMTTTTTSQASPSDHGRQLLEALGQSVAKALDTKRRLGHYTVTWQNGKPLLAGDDAPPPQAAPPGR